MSIIVVATVQAVAAKGTDEAVREEAAIGTEDKWIWSKIGPNLISPALIS